MNVVLLVKKPEKGRGHNYKLQVEMALLVLLQLTVYKVKDNVLEKKYQILIVRGIGLHVLLLANGAPKGYGHNYKPQVEMELFVPLLQIHRLVTQVKEIALQMFLVKVHGVIVLLVVNKLGKGHGINHEHQLEMVQLVLQLHRFVMQVKVIVPKI